MNSRRSYHSVLSPQHSVLFDWFLNAGMVTLLILTPLAFGAVHIWAFSLMEIGIFFLILLWAGHTLLLDSEQPPQRHVSRRSVLPILPCILFLGLILFQLLPLPPALLQAASPATYRLYQTALPGWPHHEPFADLTQFSALSGPQSSVPTQSSVLSIQSFSSWRSLSVYPPGGHEELLKLLAYGAFFVLVARKSRPRLLLFALIASGTGLALLAFFQQATWNGKILWFCVPHDWSDPQLGQGHRLRGPFVNPDHFAGYLEMLIPLAIAAVVVFGRQLRRQQRSTHNPSSRITRISQINAAFSSPQVFSLVGVTLASVLMLSALVFTLSRGGFSAMFASLFFMAWLVWLQASPESLQTARQGWLAKAGRMLCLLGFLAVPIFYLEYPQVFGRFLEIPEEMETGRSAVYPATVALWRDFPLFGVGLGNFQEVFPRYQPVAAGQKFYDYAHNDYLQLLAETGALGFALVVWSIGGGLYRVARHWRSLVWEQRLWLAGIVTGIVAMLLHSLVDFSLRIPANALVFVTLLALSTHLSDPMGREARIIA